MAIYRVLKNSTLEPEDIGRIKEAYEQALHTLCVKDRDDPPQATVAEAAALRSKFLQPSPQRVIVRSRRGIAVGLRLQANQVAGPPLRVALLIDRPGHSTSPQAGRQKFFPSISFRVDASSIVSASNFLSLRFSSSSAFSLRASETSIPP